MGNLTISLKSQSCNVFGPSPPTTWGTAGIGGTMTWGTATWGMKAAGPTGIPGIYLGIFRTLTGSNGLSISNSTYKNPGKFWSGVNTIGSTLGLPSKYLSDSNGYYYVFKGTNPNIEQEPISFASNYITGSTNATPFTTYAAQSTSWVTSVSF